MIVIGEVVRSGPVTGLTVAVEGSVATIAGLVAIYSCIATGAVITILDTKVVGLACLYKD